MKPISAVLSARSELIEARMDGRVAELKGEIRALFVRMDERDVANKETFAGIRQIFDDFRQESIQTRKQMLRLNTSLSPRQ